MCKKIRNCYILHDLYRYKNEAVMTWRIYINRKVLWHRQFIWRSIILIRRRQTWKENKKLLCLSFMFLSNVWYFPGSGWWALITAYVSYPLAKAYIYDETIMITAVTLVSALAFDSLSKEWRRKPRERKSILKRTTIFLTCCFIYLSLWCCYLYFNGKITDSEGNCIYHHQ